jgi:deoxyribose-phosphate aldolase
MNTKEILELAKTYEQKLPDFLSTDHMGKLSIAKFIDTTILKPEATPEQVEKICLEARKYQFAAVCINPVFVPQVKVLLDGSKVKVCTVVGFPLGAVPARIKAAEAKEYIKNGAAELDMVISVGLLKGAQYDEFYDDVLGVVDTAHSKNVLVKVILEMCLLERFEKIAACLLCKEAGADFVKTSTGFSTGGATIEDVELMRRVVGPRMGVKAAGGIRTLTDAKAMIKVGATRLGTSAGAKILEEALKSEGTS